jgi:hydroxymethylpyrimidine pyrophosphatase-like HAD family hydrolase
MENKIDEIMGVKIVNQHKALIDAKFAPVGTIYYNLVDENTSKGNAIKCFCQLLNIGIENCIAMGDGNNDISMFHECGYRVAMGNAMPDLKEIADYITDDNNHDGVAKYLEMLT